MSFNRLLLCVLLVFAERKRLESSVCVWAHYYVTSGLKCLLFSVLVSSFSFAPYSISFLSSHFLLLCLLSFKSVHFDFFLSFVILILKCL